MSRNNITGNSGGFPYVNTDGSGYPQGNNNAPRQDGNTLRANNYNYQSHQNNQNNRIACWQITNNLQPNWNNLPRNRNDFQPNQNNIQQHNPQANENIQVTSLDSGENNVASNIIYNNNIYQTNSNNNTPINTNIIFGNFSINSNNNQTLNPSNAAFETNKFSNNQYQYSGHPLDKEKIDRLFFDQSGGIDGNNSQNKQGKTDENFEEFKFLEKILKEATAKVMANNTTAEKNPPPMSHYMGHFSVKPDNPKKRKRGSRGEEKALKFISSRFETPAEKETKIVIEIPDSGGEEVEDAEIERKDRTPPDNADDVQIVSERIPNRNDDQAVEITHDSRSSSWNGDLPLDGTPPPLPHAQPVTAVETTTARPARKPRAATRSGRPQNRESIGSSEKQSTNKDPLSQIETRELQKRMPDAQRKLLTLMKENGVDSKNVPAYMKLFGGMIYDAVRTHGEVTQDENVSHEFRNKLSEEISNALSMAKSYFTAIKDLKDFWQTISKSTEPKLNAVLDETTATAEIRDFFRQGMQDEAAKLIDLEVGNWENFDVEALKMKIVKIVWDTAQKYQRMARHLK